MKLNSDKKVWGEFKNEKDDALSYIYYQNIDFLFFYGKKFTTDEELILDVIQDLFFHLIQKRKTLGDTENIRMYLLKSFRRRLFKELKKKVKHQELKNTYQLEPDIVFSVEEVLISAEEQSEKNIELKLGMQKLNREIDLQRASQLTLWAMPITSLYQSHVAAKSNLGYNDVDVVIGLYEGYDAVYPFITANVTTP